MCVSIYAYLHTYRCTLILGLYHVVQKEMEQQQTPGNHRFPYWTCRLRGTMFRHTASSILNMA